MDTITIYLMCENVCAQSVIRIEELASKYNRSVICLETESIILEMQELGIPQYRNSYATNLKLFAPMIIGEEIDRLLYIDCDTVVCSSLKQLLTVDLNEKPLAMVLDSLAGKHKVRVGMHGSDDYFNAGIILYNISEWRKQKCTQKIIDHVKKIRSHYMAPDQDLINIVLKGSIEKLEIYYNLQPIHFICSTNVYHNLFGTSNYYTSNQIREAIKSPIILHCYRFLGGFPWNGDIDYPNTELWNHYLSISPWEQYKKTPSEQSGIIFKVERLLFGILPRTLFMSIFKINYEWFLWKADKDSKNSKNNKNM